MDYQISNFQRNPNNIRKCLPCLVAFQKQLVNLLKNVMLIMRQKVKISIYIEFRLGSFSNLAQMSTVVPVKPSHNFSSQNLDSRPRNCEFYLPPSQ